MRELVTRRARSPMIYRLIGYLFRTMARFAHGEVGQDLDHVGNELLRLDRRSPQPATTSR